jgi:ribosomal protein S12 methylthiotransferase
VKELLIISQDTSAYGIDLTLTSASESVTPPRRRFYDLASALGELGIWVKNALMFILIRMWIRLSL